ncbi:MAG: hypothetical protein PVG30_00240 [Gammaproteobacteria bacterium]|jgi:hypothetical protein
MSLFKGIISFFNCGRKQQKSSNGQKKPNMKEQEKSEEQVITGMNAYVKMKMQQGNEVIKVVKWLCNIKQ